MGTISGNGYGASSQFFMQNAPAHIYMDNTTAEDGGVAGERSYGSALQKPEENRMNLEMMMRRALKKRPRRKNSAAQWRAFLAGYVDKNAGANDSAE